MQSPSPGLVLSETEGDQAIDSHWSASVEINFVSIIENNGLKCGN